MDEEIRNADELEGLDLNIDPEEPTAEGEADEVAEDEIEETVNDDAEHRFAEFEDLRNRLDSIEKAIAAGFESLRAMMLEGGAVIREDSASDGFAKEDDRDEIEYVPIDDLDLNL